MEKLMNHIKITSRVAMYVLIVFLIIFATAHTKIKSENQIANIFGIGFLSMTSNINELDLDKPPVKGDILIVSMSQKNQSQINTNDIVVYYEKSSQSFKTTKIIEVNDEKLHLLSNHQDQLIKVEIIDKNQVIGTYKFKIKNLGNILTYIQEASGFALLVVLPIIMMLLFESKRLIKSVSMIKKNKIEAQYQRDITIAHQLFLIEKKKIKAEMFRKYSRYQKK